MTVLGIGLKMCNIIIKKNKYTNYIKKGIKIKFFSCSIVQNRRNEGGKIQEYKALFGDVKTFCCCC